MSVRQAKSGKWYAVNDATMEASTHRFPTRAAAEDFERRTFGGQWFLPPPPEMFPERHVPAPKGKPSQFPLGMPPPLVEPSSAEDPQVGVMRAPRVIVFPEIGVEGVLPKAPPFVEPLPLPVPPAPAAGVIERGAASPGAAPRSLPARERVQEGRRTMANDVDRTPRRPAQRDVPRLAMKIDSRQVIEFSPEDKLALALALLFSLRSVGARIKGQSAEYVQMLQQWFGRGGVVVGPNRDLTDEVTLFTELFEAIPFAAQFMGFSSDEWCGAWNAIAGDVLGALSMGPPVTAGLDGPFPPVRGATVTTRFSADHPAVDLAVAFGKPIIAPEDLRVVAIKTVGGLGNHIIAVSRRPKDGKFPLTVEGPGGVILPAEGVRRHTFGHLSVFAAGLKEGDQVERGAEIGRVGSSGVSTGPHLHWDMDLYVERDGAVKMVPMDPFDFVPEDVIVGTAGVRPPAPSWSILATPGKVEEVPGTSIWIGGDMIYKGGKLETGDIDVLSRAFEGEDAFSDLEAARPLARGVTGAVGGVIGGFYGGPAGAKLGSSAGKKFGDVGLNVFESLRRQGG